MLALTLPIAMAMWSGSSACQRRRKSGWPAADETLVKAHVAINDYVKQCNEQQVRSALGYLMPDDFAATWITPAAA